jgi:hypothetical protein
MNKQQCCFNHVTVEHCMLQHFAGSQLLVDQQSVVTACISAVLIVIRYQLILSRDAMITAAFVVLTQLVFQCAWAP